MLGTTEEFAQQPLKLGMELGNQATTANRAAAQLRLNPQISAAAAQRAADAWNPWAAALSGLDSSFSLNSLFGSNGGYASSPSYSYNAPYYDTQMAGLGNTGVEGLVW